MKVLTAGQMREVDRRTIEAGIPGIVLMENAGHRVVEFLERRFAPLERQRVAVLCGKGNNGGDGFVVARQLFTRLRPEALWVVLLADPEDLQGDAAIQFRALAACGCTVERSITSEMNVATIVIDALLGTGLSGPARGAAHDGIRAINTRFPLARIVAVDLPSGMNSDSEFLPGETARADYTVTFTAPKRCHVLAPACHACGEITVAPIGSPAAMIEHDASIRLRVIGPAQFPAVLARRPAGGHKGDFGHVLVVGGAAGKGGAATLTGLAAARSGAGLVTVASTGFQASLVAPELMTAPLPAARDLAGLAAAKDVVAIGPGLGTDPEAAALVRAAFENLAQPVVVDADALNCLAGGGWSGAGKLRVLTPHPGEFARLTGLTTAHIAADRTGTAAAFAAQRQVFVVLKGERSLIAFPDATVWINPTGTPAMATGGSGDVLTGLIAGFLAQHPEPPEAAISAAVYLHGLAGERGAAVLGEKPLLATDLLRYLPEALDAVARL
ncbi:MAG: NAD(P)H-hydrate dehydratase [Bryobacterales bacterium]|nr:NAD(P)H-hydrate dehydratase [Bryobacterales bacterium]